MSKLGEREAFTHRALACAAVALLAGVWEQSFQLPHQTALTEWSAGQGFELRAGGAPIGIASVEIVEDSVHVLTILHTSQKPPSAF